MLDVKKFLHVGCGPNYKNHTTPTFASENWQEVRLDIDKSANPDIVSSVLDLSIIDSESFDAIFSSHNIEHVHTHQVPIMLKEFLRVLNSEGVFVVNCPNLIPVARLIVEDKLTEPAYVSPAGPIAPLDILYGHGASIERGNEFMAHKTGFTPKSLNAALLEAGFKSVGTMARDAALDIWAVATKQKIESKDKMIEIVNLHLPTKT
jgi:SAM-dependent methyltransferase